MTGTDLVHRALGGDRVLVVEPDADAAATLTAALRLHGFDCRAARTGAEALALLASERPRVMVTELDLPDADGCALIRRIRARPSAPEVVVVSGHTALGRRKAAAAAGAVEYKLKPTDPGELAALIHGLCRGDDDA